MGDAPRGPRGDPSARTPARSGRATGRAPLDRDTVVASALALLDSDGLGGLTMRRLGTLLDVEAMSLYHHVPSREALLDAVVDLVVDRMAAAASQADPPVDGWRGLLTTTAYGVRRTALAHPHALLLVASRPLAESWLRAPIRSLTWAEDLLDALRREGFTDEAMVVAYRSLTSMLMGHLLLEVAPHVVAVHEVPAPRGVVAGDHPTLDRLRGPLGADHGEAEFAEALGQVLDLVTAHAPAT